MNPAKNCRPHRIAPLLALLIAVAQPAGSAPRDLIRPEVPSDLNSQSGGAPAATIAEAAWYAWEEFIALNWPAAPGRRAMPDERASFDAPTDRQRVWETFRARVEVYPGIGKPWTNTSGLTDYGFDAPPRYVYDPAKIDSGDGATTGETRACSESSTLASRATDGIPLHNLDEPNHNHGRAGAAPQQPYPGQQILLESKVNRPAYVYVASHGWYGDVPIRVAKTRTGRYVRSTLSAPAPGGADPANGEALVSFPNDSIELKAAWRRLGKTDDPSRYFTRPVRYYERRGGELCHHDSSNGDDDRWALIAFHVMHKTPSAPYFIWATFEHTDAILSLERDAHGSPLPAENEDGTISAAGARAPGTFSPEIHLTPATYEDRQKVAFESTSPADPGPRLYFEQPQTPAIARVARVAINRRVFPTPAAIARINTEVQALLRKQYPGSPLSHYRLVAVQWKPLDKQPGALYSGPEDPATYYASNVVIEPPPAQQTFSGQFASGASDTSTDYLQRFLIFMNPDPNPRAPAFSNVFYGGHAYLAGGCMGCHGERQAYGTDWSFLLERQRVLAPQLDTALDDDDD